MLFSKNFVFGSKVGVTLNYIILVCQYKESPDTKVNVPVNIVHCSAI